MLFLKMLFSGFISGAARLIKFIFSDWRILVGVILLVLSVIVYFKFQSLENKLETAEQEIVRLNSDLTLERDNNAVLRSNVDKLLTINASNTKVVEINDSERKRAIVAADKLQKELLATKANLDVARKRIDNMNQPTTKLTPFLVEAVKSVQESRP